MHRLAVMSVCIDAMVFLTRRIRRVNVDRGVGEKSQLVQQLVSCPVSDLVTLFDRETLLDRQVQLGVKPVA